MTNTILPRPASKRGFAAAIGIAMRASRRAAGMSAGDVARNLGWPHFQVESVEAGDYVPRSAERELYAAVVGTTEADLLTRAWATEDQLHNIRTLRSVK